ncbi:MAG: hypothetical protein Rubg2KO_15420 [Rubricoccaceae bacterium]
MAEALRHKQALIDKMHAIAGVKVVDRGGFIASPKRFRVWDEGKMHGPHELVDLLNSAFLDGVDYGRDVGSGGESNFTQEAVWLSSTGLHDADGVELFEGDVVTVLLVPYVVKVQRGAAVLRGEGNMDRSNVGHFHQHDLLHVGNVFENPELRA